MVKKIPKEVQNILKTLNQAGFEAYIVGGCVRDLLLGRPPLDWDVTTNAKPSQIQALFKKSVYENVFGTVGVLTASVDPSLKLIEVTTYRTEGRYEDKRHPDKIKFSSRLEADLKRRDFTMNALAMDLGGKTVDLFDGQKDLKKKIIRAVGDPTKRLNEDALRLMRAVRLAIQLGFTIEEETQKAIQENASSLSLIAKERIRDELSKLFLSDKPKLGLEMLQNLGLLAYILPELKEGIGVEQTGHHLFDVWEHSLRCLQYAVEQNWSLEVRLAALFHDLGKPRTYQEQAGKITFYSHEVVGAQMTREALIRLRYPKELIQKVSLLVRHHMFYTDLERVTESSVRRLLRRVGQENIADLIKVRMADRIGSGVPKAEPYRLRHFQFLVDKVSQDPISVSKLAINGNQVMEATGLPPGPKIGYLLNILLDEVLDDPQKNQKKYLFSKIKKSATLTEEQLKFLSQKAREKSKDLEETEIQKLKDKHRVNQKRQFFSKILVK